ncbi:MAG: PdxA family protein [Burkholderiales bacterium]
MALPRIAITLGDPAGIGPEIALKAALDPRVTSVCSPLLVGDHEVLSYHARRCGLNPAIRPSSSVANLDWSAGAIPLLRVALPSGESFDLGEIRAVHGRAAVDAARAAILAARDGHVAAVVAAPQTELAIAQAGIQFDGYPGLVAQCTGTPPEDVFLMLCFDERRIAHVTLHLGLARAITLVTRERVKACITATHRALSAMGIAAPRIAVSGLNPHAGEGGLFGDEEIHIIAPAIEAAKKEGIRAEGPFGADIMYNRPGYDAFVVMIHDQGHIPAKLLGENRTAAITIGTPVLFSSVAHGSALDIAGKNRASHEAVVEAICRLTGTAGGGPMHRH